MTKTLRSLFLIIFTLFSLNVAFGQGEANVWIGPTQMGLDFNAGSPTAFVTGPNKGVINAVNYEGEGCSSVADAAGNLLFYTEGVNVYNRNHVVMGGGAGLMGNLSSTQSAIIVPCPAAPTRFYYIFCAPPEEASASPGGSSTSTDGITYSIVDMTLNAGLGGVTATKNVRVTPAGEGATEGLTAVPNLAGNGFWIIGHQAGTKGTTGSSSKFYIYGVTTAGITAGTGVITAWNNQSANAGTAIQGIVTPVSGNGQVIIKSNSCFNKLAMSFFAKSPLIELYNFNNSTGAISLANSITNVINNQVYGLEFSPNGTYLYATIIETNKRLYQFDISSGVNATINAARTEWTPAGSASLRWGQLQLGPDGRIYMSHHVNWDVIGSGAPHASIGVINSPNTGGAGANFVEQQITSTTLTGTGTKHGLPQFYKGFVAGVLDFGDDLPTIAGVKLVCRGTLVNFLISFTGTMKPNTLDVNWGDGNIQTNIAGTPTSLSHTYAVAGDYTVQVTFEDICDNPYSIDVPIKVVPPPTGTITCLQPDRMRFDVTGTINGTSTYVWYKTAGGVQTWGTGTTLTTPVLTPAFPTDVYLYEATGASSVVTFNNNQPLDGNNGSVVNNIVIKKQVLIQSFDVRTFTNFSPCTSVTATVRDGSSTVVATVTISPPGGACGVVTFPLNVSLPPGNYSITMTGTGGTLFYFTANHHRITPIISALMDDNGAGAAAGDGPAYNFKLIDLLGSCSRVQIVAGCTLPVTWLSFGASRSGGAVAVNWSTATEQNANVFYVQRSLDGIHFETIGQVAASGNSNSVKSYEYIDANAPSGNVYYRLLEEDFDGASMHSSIVYVNGLGLLNLSLVPNPGNGSFKIVGLSGDEKLTVTVYTITGQSVFSTTTSPYEVVDLAGLAKGFYVVRVLVGNTEQSIRFINQ